MALFPMLANVILESIGASVTAAHKSVLFHLSLCPLLIRLFSKIKQCVSNNIINIKIAIFDLFIHLAQKRP
jgi:hypothetical protein